LQTRSLQSGAFRRFGLVQIVLEASKIRGVSRRQGLYMTGAVAACFDGYVNGLFSRTHRQHHIQNLELNLCYTLKKSLLCVRLLRHSMRAADVASTSPKYEFGKVAFSSMFLKRKKSQRFGASSFSKCHYTRQKNPFASLGRSYTEQKNHFTIILHSPLSLVYPLSVFNKNSTLKGFGRGGHLETKAELWGEW